MAPKRDAWDASSSRLVDSWVGSSHSSLDPNFGFIESLYHACATTLHHLWKFRHLLSLTLAQQASLKENVGQLSLWEENFPSCRLDTILGHSNYLRMEVLENLVRIGKILMHYRRIISAHPENKTFTDGLEDLNPLVEKAAVILSDNDTSDSSTDSNTDSDSSSLSEAGRNQQGRLHCYIGCLLELGPTIEKQIANIQFKLDRQALPDMNPFSLSLNAQPFAIRIKDRFRDAKIPLVERLAEANWERSVRMMIHAEESSAAEQTTPARSVPATAMTLFKPFSLFHDSGLGTSIPSRSLYAATVASHSSYLSVAAEDDEGRPRVPPLPHEGLRGQTFQCPFCGTCIKCRDRIEWKMHVFSDLQAYVCTHDACKDALRTFTTRKEWADHEFKNHFSDKQWTCFSCSTRQDTPDFLLDHIRSAHGIELREPHFKFELSRFEEHILKSNFKDHACSLCLRSGWQTMKAYATHVGRHLEEISLACLPKLSGDDPGSDSNVSQKSLSSIEPATQVGNATEKYKTIAEEVLALDAGQPHTQINEWARNVSKGTYETDDSDYEPIQPSKARLSPEKDVYGPPHGLSSESDDEPIQSSRGRTGPVKGIPKPPPGSPENSDDEQIRLPHGFFIETNPMKKAHDNITDDSDEEPIANSREQAKYECSLCESRPQFTTLIRFSNHISHHFPRVLYQCQMCKATRGLTLGQAWPKDPFISHMRDEHDIQDIALQGSHDDLFKTLSFEPPKTCPYDVCNDALHSWDDLWDHCQDHSIVPDPGRVIQSSLNSGEAAFNPFTPAWISYSPRR
ncbi:hypothetical protein BJX64DRAFT_77028 [Aspergillus heterothallicus]